VPNYQGKKADDAEKALKTAGFNVTVNEQFSDTVDKGVVISQTPANGTAFKNDTITLNVSKGPELFKVPDVTSNLANPASWTTLEQASKALTDAGFQVKVVDKGRFGIVVKQDPKGGSMKPHGTVVSLWAD
jgi:serine/threonine-protein kinase